MTTVHLPLIFSMNKHEISEWWVDVSFAVHDDIQSSVQYTVHPQNKRLLHQVQ